MEKIAVTLYFQNHEPPLQTLHPKQDKIHHHATKKQRKEYRCKKCINWEDLPQLWQYTCFDKVWKWKKRKNAFINHHLLRGNAEAGQPQALRMVGWPRSLWSSRGERQFKVQTVYCERSSGMGFGALQDLGFNGKGHGGTFYTISTELDHNTQNLGFFQGLPFLLMAHLPRWTSDHIQRH